MNDVAEDIYNVHQEVLDRYLFEKDSDDLNLAVMPPPDIVSFNEMRSCADLYRMYEKGGLEIKPDFQRGIVWKTREMSLFVDSLIKRLPIPSLCVSFDSSTGQRMVIDGLQRIWTIISFLGHDKKDWKLSITEGIDNRLSGRMISEIRKEYPRLYQTLEDATIPINIIHCNYQKKEHMEYLFQIFSRLNSGGRRLLYQEIRNCVFQGPFNSFLKYYVHTEKWRLFVGQTDEEIDQYRFGNEERVLRFLAFFERWEKYTSSLVHFLNSYMQDHRMMSDTEVARWKNLLDETLDIVLKVKDKKETRKNWNAIEGVLIGIAKNLDYVRGLSDDMLNEKFACLITSSEYTDRMKEGVMHGTKVRDRIKLSVAIFGK